MNKKTVVTPCVSVIMSVYNGAKFLMTAVDSILNQTLRNFEFIIVNDGSTDKSLTILQNYAAQDSRIRLISRENKGLTISLNEAVALARGEWIARMDADDISLPDRLNKQLAWLHETGAAVCGGQAQLIGTRPSRTRASYVSNEAIRIKMLFGSPFVHPAVMLRADVAINNPYSEDALYVEDYELWARLAMGNIKMTNHPDIILQYRIHAQQITVIKQKLQRENMVSIYEMYSKFLLRKDQSMLAGYLLVADKQREVNDEGFAHALAFLNELIRTNGNPEDVVSNSVFSFLTRCGTMGRSKVMHAANTFKLGRFQKAVLLTLSTTRISSKGKLYHLLYRLR